MKEREKTPASSRIRILCLLAVIFASGAVFFAIRIALDPYSNKILPNVTIANVAVGGMTRYEARKALQDTADRLAGEDMVISLPEETLYLSPKDTEATLLIGEAVKAAFAYGRSGSQEERQAAYESSQTKGYAVNLHPYLRLNEDAVYAALQAYAEKYDTDYSACQYELEGQQPGLEEETYQETAPCQTLLLTMGTPEVKLNLEEVYAKVMEAYQEGRLLVEIEEVLPSILPEEPDLEAIYLEICTEPLDASLDLQTYERLSAVYGYVFDLEKAKELVSSAEYGQTVSIPMEIIAPEVLGDDVYFQDVLGAYNSGHSDRLNIVTNLGLVCDFLDGIVIQPGEVFSYNDAVGERTVERGFLYGESFTGFSESRSAGGGVCQGSSVLYVCALTAELEIVERVNHGIEVTYTPPGQDAAVSWGGPDFQFRNSTHFPIMITAELAESQLRIQLLGTEEKDYYIELESTYGHDEHQSYANVYMCKYDRQTGELISREKVSHSAYQYTG